VPLPWSDAAAVDPEELFVASLSACHMLWFLDLASRAGWVVERYEDQAAGTMARRPDGRWAMAAVTLHPQVAFAGAAPDPAALRALHDAAHAECFIANSVACAVHCEPRP
jgi:organic hydroperoxide reductase OsmC/OhrA